MTILHCRIKCGIISITVRRAGKKPDPKNSRQLWLQFINADSEEEYEMIDRTNVPIMQKAVHVIYDMSEDTRIREIARLWEKALHDEASALKNAKSEGEAIGIAKGEAKGEAKERNKTIERMKELGMTDEQIKAIYFGR